MAMPRPILDEDVKPLSEFRSNVTTCIKQARRTKRPVVITHHGKSAAVLLDVSEYEAIMEKMDILQDVRTAEEQVKAGKGVPHDRALDEVLRRVRG
jgi:prevent-host-death family protein